MNLTEKYNTDKIGKFKRSLYVQCYLVHGHLEYHMRSTVSRFPYHYIENVIRLSIDNLYDIAITDYHAERKDNDIYFPTQEDCEDFIVSVKGLRMKGA